MRKLFLTMSILVMTTVIMAQQFPLGPIGKNTPDPGRNNEFFCMPNAVFSQVFPTYSGAFYCQSGYTFYRAADNYMATGPFSTLRFWGADFYGCTLAPTEMFDIFIWNGDPRNGGTLIHSFSLPVNTMPIGVSWIGTQFYQIDIDFGTAINQSQGWIGITRTGPSCYQGTDFGFAWACSGNGNAMSYNSDWLANGSNLMFCLGAAEPVEEVPISNWALFIGIGLILVSAVIRFRRIS
ncbi:MAG: hypothetical protein HGA23_12150 [Bacteroidales bacterium]|nr:hypothetical protein [Bacteroidales bacterium]